jgi:hypothetical protein
MCVSVVYSAAVLVSVILGILCAKTSIQIFAPRAAALAFISRSFASTSQSDSAFERLFKGCFCLRQALHTPSDNLLCKPLGHTHYRLYLSIVFSV